MFQAFFSLFSAMVRTTRNRQPSERSLRLENRKREGTDTPESPSKKIARTTFTRQVSSGKSSPRPSTEPAEVKKRGRGRPATPTSGSHTPVQAPNAEPEKSCDLPPKKRALKPQNDVFDFEDDEDDEVSFKTSSISESRRTSRSSDADTNISTEMDLKTSSDDHLVINDAEDPTADALMQVQEETSTDWFRTIVVRTPKFIDIERSKLIPSIHPNISPEHVDNYFLSYFFFIQFDSYENLLAYRASVSGDVGTVTTPYCPVCPFILNEARLLDHIPDCQSDENRDLNRLFKVTNQMYPHITTSSPNTVLLVKTFECVDLKTVDSFKKMYTGVVNVTFSGQFFVRLKSKDLAKFAARKLNRSKEVKFDGDEMEAHTLCHTTGFKNLLGNTVKAEKKVLVKSMEQHLLGLDLAKVLLILGSCGRFVSTKSNSGEYIARLKTILNCDRVVMGPVERSGKRESDFSHFVIAVCRTKEDALKALKVCKSLFEN